MLKLSSLRKRQKLETAIAPKPSDLAQFAKDLPRSVKKRHRMEVRRDYRLRQGVMSSVQREILAESVARKVYAERERQAAEDARYLGAT